MTFSATQDIYRKHSLLKRHPRHTPEAFSHHYETFHGPLASNQAGFRLFTTRYIQNHTESSPGGGEPTFDGITMTTQVPRSDYSTGFFTHPDYVNVKPDEMYLFDIERTISVLGKEEIVIDGSKSPHKVVVITSRHRMELEPLKELLRVEFNNLDTSTASALGFGKSSFSHDLIAELWFASGTAREMAWHTIASRDPAAIPLLVREVLFFSLQKPWVVA